VRGFIMFVSVVAEVEIDGPVSIPVTHGEAMQAELLRQIAAFSPEAAEELHGTPGGGMRPYTVSRLGPGRLGMQNGRLQYEHGDRAWFRLTGIGPLPCQALLALAERSKQWRLESFRAAFGILRWFVSPDEHPWAGITEMSELLESGWNAASIEPQRAVLLFHSPTTFELSEERWGNWMPLPIPKLVFGNLREHALSCTPIGEPPLAGEIIENHIALGQFSQITSHEKHRRSGFTGECEFLFDRDLPEPALVWLHLLANMAFYLGVGRATTQGKGQARREPIRKFSYRGGAEC
jgi:hypothetical protein